MSKPSGNTWITTSLSILWRSATILLVCAAVLITAIRLSLPHTNHINAHVTQYLSQQLNAHIVIGKIDGYWEGNGPHLTLHQVNLTPNSTADSQAQGVEFELNNIYVEVDLFASILQWSIVTEKFELQGLQLDLDVNKAKPTDLENTSSNLPDLLQDILLNKLEYFSVVESSINIKQTNQTQHIDIKQLSWINNGVMHKGTGEIFFNNNPENIAQVSAQLIGQPDNLHGTVFLETQKIAFGRWLSAYVPAHIELDQSAAQGNAWLTIDGSAITQVRGQITPTQLRWKDAQSSLITSIQNIDFMAIPQGDNWLVNAQNVVVGINDTTLAMNFSALRDATGTWSLSSITPFAVAPLQAVGEFFLSGNAQSWLMQAQPQAQVSNIELVANKAQWLGQITFDHVALQQTSLPGVNDLQLIASFKQTKSTTAIDSLQSVHSPVLVGIQIKGEEQSLLTDRLLAQNITMHALDASLYLSIAPYEFSILPSRITLASDLVQADVELAYRGSEDVLSISALLAPETAKNVVKLLPTTLMGTQTYQYLVNALDTDTQTGTITPTRLIWHGAGQDFPFERNNGIFQARLFMHQGQFKFGNQWPMLSELDLELAFENNDLVMRAPSGKILDITLADLTATLPGLSSQSLLTIDATGSGSGYALAQVMAQSSLANSLGQLLNENIIISNALSANLNLQIPLDNDDVIASGTIDFPNNYIQFTDVDLALTQAQGQLSFVNDKITVNTLSAKLFDQPIALSLDGANSTDGYTAKVALSGDWDVAQFAHLANAEYAHAFAGQATWQGRLNLQLPQSGMHYTFDLNSDLVGVTHSLPAPFAKTPDTIMPLSIRATGTDLASEINATLGDDVRFAGVLPHKEKQFSRAHLALGASEFQGTGVGFSISANLPRLDVSEWYQTLDRLLAGFGGTTTPIFSTPERIFMAIDQVTLANQTIHNINATAKQSDNNWQIDLNAREARGTVRLFNDWLGSGIDIQADYINISSLAQTPLATSRPSIDPRTLPPIAFTCTQCRVVDNNLGEVTLRTTPTETGMRINQLMTQNDHGGVNLTGTWDTTTDASSRTAINGEITSDDFGAFLNEFTFSTGIKDSAALFKLDLAWDNAPFDFAFADVNGNVDWSLSDGYLTEISDKGSRIFTLLSLDSLVRKLSLDFRDVFAKGFFYDKINGTMTIENGIAFTQDTVVDGGAGEIDIAGYSDLVNQELNYTVSFAPNVTGNLPALVYFMVNPPTAIAALAVNQVLTSAKVFSNINYSISGAFSAPVVTELERQSTEVQLPQRQNVQVLKSDDVPLTEIDKIPVNLQPQTK
jgi:uncharacterized protein (TIGR02099 family)